MSGFTHNPIILYLRVYGSLIKEPYGMVLYIAYIYIYPYLSIYIRWCDLIVLVISLTPSLPPQRVEPFFWRPEALFPSLVSRVKITQTLVFLTISLFSLLHQLSQRGLALISSSDLRCLCFSFQDSGEDENREVRRNVSNRIRSVQIREAQGRKVAG